MKRLAEMSEAEMARAVVAELQLLGYETYEEVCLGYGGKRADIVGVRGSVLTVVECKTSMSLRLLDQVCEWHGYAHQIIAAVPYCRRGQAVFRLLTEIGAGLWMVGQFDGVKEDIAPRLNRTAPVAFRLRRSLNKAQRSGTCLPAGSSGGGYWTPFLGTCRALAETVREAPGITLRDALVKAGHHYASTKSALSAMPGLIRKGVVVGVRLEDGKPLRLYPATESATSHPARILKPDGSQACGSALPDRSLSVLILSVEEGKG